MTELSEIVTSLGFLGALLALFLIGEFRTPHRAEQRPDLLRMLQSVTLFALGALLARLVLPVTVVAASIFAQHSGWGVLNLLDAPLVLAVPLTLLAMDLTNFLRHWVQHNVPLLWRLHRLHHSDTQIDLATALRFHPLEALFTSLCHLTMVVLLGLPFEGVVLYLVAEVLFDFWEHGNLRTPRRLAGLQDWIVTPPVHRIHHEAHAAHRSVNYGTLFTAWDRLAGTFVAAVPTRPEGRYGLHDPTIQVTNELGSMLADPLRGDQS